MNGADLEIESPILYKKHAGELEGKMTFPSKIKIKWSVIFFFKTEVAEVAPTADCNHAVGADS